MKVFNTEMPFLGWGMCKWHLGFLLVVSSIGIIFFSFFPPLLDF
jgi:hypothetical protein